MVPKSHDAFHLNSLAACAQFASAIAAWGDVVRVAAVDCAERENVVIIIEKHYFNFRKGKDPDPYLWLMDPDPDPGDPKKHDPQHCRVFPSPITTVHSLFGLGKGRKIHVLKVKFGNNY